MSKEILKYKSKDETFRGKNVSKEEKEKRFIKDIKENGIYDKIIIKSEFVNFSTKILCQCKKHTDYEWWITPNHLREGRCCPLCGEEKRVKSRKTSNEDFLKQFNEVGKKQEIEILERFDGFRTKDNTAKFLKCCCKKENHIFYMSPEVLLRGCGCPICANQKRIDTKIKKGETQFLKYLEDNDIHLKMEGKYIKGNEPILFKCLDCGNNWMVTPSKIKQGRRCPFCNDGFSFNNKVLRILFDILKPNNCKTEFIIPESKEKYRYDGYFVTNNEKILVELDGSQHKKESKNLNWTNIKQQRKIDRIKNKLAKKYKYRLIRVDCSGTHKQNIEKIKNSKLKDLLDFFKIDWNNVHKKAEKSVMTDVCSFIKNNPNKKLEEYCQIFNLSESAIEQYIKTGKELNMLPKNFSVKTKSKNFYYPDTNTYFIGKPIMVFENNSFNIPIYIFTTCSKCAKFLQEKGKGYTDTKIVKQVALGNHGPYKGYIFKYATQEDLNKYKNLIVA